MPKAKHTPTPEEQRKRFEAEVQKLINAGELDPHDAAQILDDLVRRSAHPPPVKR